MQFNLNILFYCRLVLEETLSLHITLKSTSLENKNPFTCEVQFLRIMVYMLIESLIVYTVKIHRLIYDESNKFLRVEDTIDVQSLLVLRTRDVELCSKIPKE